MYNSGIGTPYWYEWNIGILECLRLLTDNDISSVVLQSSEYQVLDDVVVNFADGSSSHIQVKHTDVDTHLTYTFLSGQSLLENLAVEWKRNKENHRIREIQLVTNMKWGTNRTEGKASVHDFITIVYPEMKKDISYSGKDKYEQESIKWFKKELRVLGDDLEEFVKIFSFRPERNLEGVEKQIENKVAEIVGTEKKTVINSCVDSIESKMRIWATSRREKPEITREDVYKALCPEDPQIPTYELYPEKPIFPSRIQFADSYLKKLEESKSSMFFLKGYPGSGKTNFVSYLAQKRDSIVDFRFYTYLPVSKDCVSYSDDEGNYLGRLLWKSILAQLKVRFSELGILSEIAFPVAHQFLSVSEMRACVLKYLPVYAKKMNRDCYLFIDGIDHAARSNNAKESFLFQLPKPEELGEGVKIILVGQPVNDKYPTWLENNPNIEYDIMPSMEAKDIVAMIKDCNNIGPEIDAQTLAETIISVTGSNALNVLFALQEIKRLDQPASFEKVEKSLKKRGLNNQIDKYYEWIISSVKKCTSIYALETVFAFSSQKMSLQEISAMCDLREEDTSDMLSDLHPLILEDAGLYYAFHNDVRLYFETVVRASNRSALINTKLYEKITNNEKLFKFQYDIAYGMTIWTKEIKKLFNLINVDYVMNSILYDISFEKIYNQFIELLRLLNQQGAYDYLPQAACLALVLSQFAKNLRFYEKDIVFLESLSPLTMKKSEKYMLDPSEDYPQIVDDMHYLFVNECNARGMMLFNEYFSEKSLNELLYKLPTNASLCNKLGFVWRCMDFSIEDVEFDEGKHEYFEFVDGWLQASSSLVFESEIRKTLSIKGFYSKSMREFVENLLINDIDESAYVLLKSIFISSSISISTVVELCVYGIVHGFQVSDIVEYLDQNRDQLLTDDSYRFESERIVGFFKLWFCIFSVAESDSVNELYERILNAARITGDKRGFKPAVAQKELANTIYETYYNEDASSRLTQDTVIELMYFKEHYGVGSSNDCEAYRVIDFLRSIFLEFSKKNASSEIVIDTCKLMLKIVKQEPDRAKLPSGFMELFYIADDKERFIELADFWCGENGVAWHRNYSDCEYYCKNTCIVLHMFGEKEKEEEIQERLKFRLFGYVDNKDYSLIPLLEYYRRLPLSENKLLVAGKHLLEISDAANEIGDNRIDYEIEDALRCVSLSLGYRYANALFEIKNKPDTFVEWRMGLLKSMFDSLDKKTDEDLVALHALANAWIVPRIEASKPYGRLDQLAKYNQAIIQQVKDDTLRATLLEKGNCCYTTDELPVEISESPVKNKYFNMLDQDGYNESFENAICTQMRDPVGGFHSLVIKLACKIPYERRTSFADRCVNMYIKTQTRYGYVHTGMIDLFDTYYMWFGDETWNSIFQHIIDNSLEDAIDSLNNLGDDISIFTMFYSLRYKPHDIGIIFSRLCDTHDKIITGNGRFRRNEYKLTIDPSITTLSKLVEYQLGNLDD